MDRILELPPENAVVLRGVVLETPEYSHENHGKQFMHLTLSVERLSGVYDHLPVIAGRELLEAMDPTLGPMVELEGQIRSYNNRTGQGSRLVISVYAQRIQYCSGPPENSVSLTGKLCREPVYRRTPLGREITDVMLSVERKYQRRDYIPCILWGSVARTGAEWSRGTELRLLGRLQSRCYVKQTDSGAEQRTAYEVSAISAQQLEDACMDRI